MDLLGIVETDMQGDTIGARLERGTKNRYRIVWIGIFNSLTTKFFQRKKKCMQKKKKKNQDTRRDSNSRSRELELNALTTWLLHYIAILENYKNFITNLSKKFWRPF